MQVDGMSKALETEGEGVCVGGGARVRARMRAGETEE